MEKHAMMILIHGVPLNRTKILLVFGIATAH